MRTQVIREKTEPIVDFIAKPFLYMHFSPNIISFFSIITLIVFFPMLKNGYFYVSALMILLNGFFDIMDGAVAKATGKSSALGTLVDRTIDKISDGVILAAYVLYGLVSIPLGIYTLVVMFLATNVSANIEAVLHFKISNSISLRFFRIIVLILFTILQQFKIMFIILAVISTYSMIYRLLIAYSIYSKKK
jgi:CDP-diacylglycerol--glycerol-3-phosphate 3-phosphatidyltransferase|tara:strand:+ start:2174 stop:2746 length:573 start_codon:yes stop_codon:yes gene_type:complete